MIESLIESIESYLETGEVDDSLELQINFTINELRQRIDDEDGDSSETVPVLPVAEVIEELKFLRNNLFSEACYKPDIIKSLDSLKTFAMFLESTETSSLDKTDKCPDIHANLDNYFDELLTDIPENRFLTANYLEILDAVDEYEDSGIPKALLELVDEKVRVARDLKEKYLNLSITEREITQEFLAGNEYLLSGLELWEEALINIGDGCSKGDNIQIQHAMEKLDEANEILVVVQHHAEKVREKSE